MKKDLTKYITGILLVLIAVLFMPTNIFAASTWDGETATYEWYGDGSATEYHLSTASDLYGFARITSNLEEDMDADDFYGKTVYLDNDIDLDENEWTPIGGAYNVTSEPPYITFNYEDATSFKGTFNGQNHYIDNLKISTITSPNGTLVIGFFANTENATIKNLTLKNVNVDLLGSKAEVGSYYAGALVGEASGGTFENITITNGSIKSNMDAGGLFGFTGDGSTIKNCQVNINVESANYAGGIAGQIGGSSSNSTATTASPATTTIINSGFNGTIYLDGGLTVTDYIPQPYAWAGYVFGSVASYTVVNIDEFTVGPNVAMTAHADLRENTRANMNFFDTEGFIKGDSKFELFGGIGRGGYNTGIFKFKLDGVTYTSERAVGYFNIVGTQVSEKNVTMKNNSNVTITDSLTIKGNLIVPNPDETEADFPISSSYTSSILENTVFKKHGYLVVGDGAKLVVNGTLTAGTDNANILGSDEKSMLVADKVYLWDTETSKWIAEATPTASTPIAYTDEDDSDFKLVETELTAANKELVEEYIAENDYKETDVDYIIKMVDINLQKKAVGSDDWTDAEVEGTINILVPYPEGTNKDDFDFTILHFTSLDPVTAEELEYVKTDQGLLINATSLSPVVIMAQSTVVEPAPENPNTLDSIYIYGIVGMIAMIGLGLTVTKIKKYN